MKTNNENGRKLACIIGVYLILKAFVNIAVSGSFSIGDLALAIIEAAALYTGLMYINYAVAAICLLVVAQHLKTNLSDISSHILYLVEAAIDVACAVLLIVNNDIKQHFSNKWSDIFGK